MADTRLATAQRFQSQPQDPSQARRNKRQLNPIIEEDSDDSRSLRKMASMGQQARRVDKSHLTIEAWLSPMSDHFPTPRGINYLSAPIFPSSPSSVSGDGSSPTMSSQQWTRSSVATDNTEFEDLYDVSDDEGARKSLQRRPSVRKSSAQASQGKLPMRVHIPSNDKPSSFEDIKKLSSPMPLTPSAQLSMSPAQVNFMGKQQALEVPTISAPPSLDGSLTSDQLASMSAPVTPVIDNDEKTTEEAWVGVHLQPGALATLHALSSDHSDSGSYQEQPEQVLEIPQESPQPPSMEMRQQPLRLITNFRAENTTTLTLSPIVSRKPHGDLARLEIPSPGGFLAGLSPRTQSAWQAAAKAPEAMAPPTSATAEQFYRAPWNMNSSVPPVPKKPEQFEDFYRGFEANSATVERIVELYQDDVSDDMPTARPVPKHQDSGSSGETLKAPASPGSEDAPAEIIVDCDPKYAKKQQEEALSNLDRTESWLLAQRAYLRGVDEKEEEEGLETIAEADEEEEAKGESSQAKPKEDTSVLPMKKTVRFSDLISANAQPKRLPSKLSRQESAYYRAFQDYVVRSNKADVFVHQLTRFEALQAQRVSLKESHRNQLLGKYQLSVVPQSAKKRLSANVARGDDTILDDPEKIRKEKEYEAKTQMAMPTWHVAAMKFLNGGKLISAPVTKRLARLSRMSAGKDGVVRERARVLDLGGQSTCDWAWHCAMQYPNTKVYTVTTKSIRQMSNSNVRGPPNHRQVAVERMSRLPFPDNHFDLISARELHSILKFVGENGEDEWETCVRECMRILKPGGFLEFSLLDSDIINAGPLSLAKSVEFGFSLKTLGYDPSPSKMWLGRLARAGFQDVRRTWLCMPMGAKSNLNKMETAPDMDAPVMGSADNIAGVCSIVGGWSWERWLLRCEMEKVSGELRLADTVTTGEAMKEAGKCLDGVAAVMEEGRNRQSGFRMLNGYAMKPKKGTEVIQIGFGN